VCTYFPSTCNVPFPSLAEHEVSGLEPPIMSEGLFIEGRIAEVAFEEVRSSNAGFPFSVGFRNWLKVLVYKPGEVVSGYDGELQYSSLLHLLRWPLSPNTPCVIPLRPLELGDPAQLRQAPDLAHNSSRRQYVIHLHLNLGI
jgi:hypothetical protein